MKKLILENAPTAEIAKYILGNGALSFAEDGVTKVAAGLTTLEEVARVVDLDLNFN
jgi:type II secretory ATPase GspE/PulE/Tfp pilus assembly ATPase PilB-like protein